MTSLKILTVGANSAPLAQDRVTEGLFTTIACRLEPQGRASRFPVVMDDLYSGYLTPARATRAQAELQEIESALRNVPVSDIVWSLSELARGNDANDAVNHQAANALEYFVDVHGRPLISRLKDAVQECCSTGRVLRIWVPGDDRAFQLAGLGIAGSGLGWMWLGRAFAPNVIVVPFTNKGGIPLWTFGMDLVMFGVAMSIAGTSPALRDWFGRRLWVVNVLAIGAVLAWLGICAVAGYLPD